MGLVSELRRRNVIRVAIAYAIAAWLLIEVSATTFPMLRLPEWTATFVTVLLLIGFPVALIFAWASFTFGSSAGRRISAKSLAANGFANNRW